VKDFIEIQDNTLEEIVYNAMILFRHNDLGAKIDTSLNREIKKETGAGAADSPTQLRLRLHNRFNMDLNNVYALEIYTEARHKVVETSVNVYHDDFKLEDFQLPAADVFEKNLRDVNMDYVMKRFQYNFRNATLHWKAAKAKQFIIDPQVDRLKQMHDAFEQFSKKAKSQLKPLHDKKIREFLTHKEDVVLEKRKMSYAKSRILKVYHNISAPAFTTLMEHPQLFSALLLEYCLVPLFLANELYVMSLIYKRSLDDIRTILSKRVQEV